MGSEVKFNSINQDLVERARSERARRKGRTDKGASASGGRYAYALPLSLLSLVF